MEQQSLNKTILFQEIERRYIENQETESIESVVGSTISNIDHGVLLCQKPETLEDKGQK